MANTIFDASHNQNLIPKHWAKKLWLDAQDNLFWKRFIGEGAGSIIQKNTDLAKNHGDQVTFGLSMKLSGAGVDGDATLEGNEEALTFYDMPVTVNQKRHAVRLEGEMTEQRSAFNLRARAKEALQTWLEEYLDKLFFTTLGSTPSTNRKILTSSAHTTVATMDGNDKLTCAYISKVKRAAMLASPKVNPVVIGGKAHYALVVHPYTARDLKTDTVWINAQQYANVRGSDNPLFNGALGIWDDVVLFEHEYVKRAGDGAASAQVSYNLLLGAQAGVWAVAKEPYWKEKLFDYENSVGFATGLIHGVKKSVFNSEDFGLMTVIASAAGD